MSTLLPYAAWCVWVRLRVGEFPFLAHTVSRTQAISWPGNGIHQVLAQKTPDHDTVVTIVLGTFVLCAAGAFAARRFPLGGLTAALAVLTVCLGVNALRYSEETLRLLTVPLVFAVLALAVGIASGRFPILRRVAARSSVDAAHSMRD